MATEDKNTATGNFAWLQHSETLLSVGLLGVLLVMIIPLPPFVLDLVLAVNLSMSILLLLVTFGAQRALELSVFPSLLLLLTLFRLALNVATTRRILLSADAGRIVTAFGEFVVGGDLVVGLVIFLILVVIQFVVITKGAGRISEVAARFTLDALPGKQMAIDAELGSGAIDDKEARVRRRELAAETEFYGAMDGASKFVRGDAIAGLAITAINLVGGIVIGLSHGLNFSESAYTYAILTVGDGLVSQIPALIIATTAGILVTKATSEESLGQEIGSQVLRNERPLWAGAAILGLLALVPGLPKLPFIGMAAGMLVMLSARRKQQEQPAAKPDESGDDPPPAREPDDEQHLREFLLTDRANVEVGTRLVPLIHTKRQKGLAERITTLRREFSADNGLWIPPIRVRSNLELRPEEYRILVAGRQVASGTLRLDHQLAILPETVDVNLPGEETTEPAFGLPAKWIPQSISRQAESLGATVVDPISVLITHLGEVLKQHGHELITRETLKQMLDHVKEFAPTVVEEVRSETVRMSTLHQVLVQLAEEHIPLSDMAYILESVVNHAPSCKSPEELTDRVRGDLGTLVCERYRDAEGRLRIIAIDPSLEARLRDSLREGHLALPPGPLEKLIASVGTMCQDSLRHGQPLAMLSDRSLRRPLRRVLHRAVPQLGFISYQEVPDELMIQPTGLVRLDQVFETNAGGSSGGMQSGTSATLPQSHAAVA
ncbi:flagellar biosynthesis protein FlhA [Maioricimonas sp. JC845]|uniref:flagellar biosynthesis protein FlhA n=1 Tax=Maioricimonas sp. JC845 TaxID=3232138 RepID=UPI00345AF7A0